MAQRTRSPGSLTGSPRHLRKKLPPKYVRTKDVWKLAARGLAYGATRKSVYLTEWNAAGRCSSPVTVQMTGRPYSDVSDLIRASAGIDIEVRCRKCEACLKARGALWRDRAVTEVKASSRTWFGTLTLSSERQHHALCVARKVEALQGCDFDAFGDEEQFALRVAVIGKEITKFLKRVRKETQAPFRYMLVAERHKSGDPHFHMLLHETSVDAPVRKCVLHRQWTWGFSSWKLAETEAALYVCKYLTKCSEARVRASLHYGQTYDLDHSEPVW